MLVFGIMEVILPILWHHRPIGPLQSSSPLPSSKDIPFLTLVAELHSSLAFVRYAEECGSFRFTEAGRLARVAGSGLTIALFPSLCDREKTWSGWKSSIDMCHFTTAGFGYHYLDSSSSLPGHLICHQTYTPFHIIGYRSLSWLRRCIWLNLPHRGLAAAPLGVRRSSLSTLPSKHLPIVVPRCSSAAGLSTWQTLDKAEIRRAGTAREESLSRTAICSMLMATSLVSRIRTDRRRRCASGDRCEVSP